MTAPDNSNVRDFFLGGGGSHRVGLFISTKVEMCNPAFWAYVSTCIVPEFKFLISFDVHLLQIQI
jgi:hypothetical protein